MVQIELLYLPDCPNVGPTRANLRAALVQAGLLTRWRERNLADADTPTTLRHFGSPTVLIDGKDLDDASNEARPFDASCCRIYAGAGTPSVRLILANIERAASTPPKRTWMSGAAGVPAIAAGLLPAAKCPACLAAYTGVFSSFGLTSVLLNEILLPLTIVLVVLSLATLAFRARKRRGYAPLGLGIAASVALLVGKFWLDWPFLWYAGIAALAAASLWNAWPRKAAPATDCPACDPPTHGVSQ